LFCFDGICISLSTINGFATRTVPVEFVVEQVALVQVFLQALCFFLPVPFIYQSQYPCIRKTDYGHFGDHTATETEPGVTNGKQDRQCTYNVTLRCVRAPLLRWENDKYYISWVCVCSLSFPACNAHAPCCHLWPVQLFSIFPHHLINGMIFEIKKKVTEHKLRVLIFSTTFIRNISRYKKKLKRYQKFILIFT